MGFFGEAQSASGLAPFQRPASRICWADHGQLTGLWSAYRVCVGQIGVEPGDESELSGKRQYLREQ